MPMEDLPAADSRPMHGGGCATLILAGRHHTRKTWDLRLRDGDACSQRGMRKHDQCGSLQRKESRPQRHATSQLEAHHLSLLVPVYHITRSRCKNMPVKLCLIVDSVCAANLPFKIC